MIVKPALVGVVTAVLTARPAAAGVEDAIRSAARDVAEGVVTDATEVEGRGAVGVVARAVGLLEAAVAVAAESLVQDGFGVAPGVPAVERAGFEVAVEAEPDEFRAEWGEPGVGPVGSRVESGALEVARGAFAVGLNGFPVAWDGQAELLGDYLDELVGQVGFRAGLGGWAARLVGLDGFQVGLAGRVELLVDQGD